jgi:hypothetical protein
MEQLIAGGNFGHHFDEKHNPSRHYKAKPLKRKMVAVSIIFHNRRRYRLINPILFRKVLGESLASTLLNRPIDKRKAIVM